MARAREFGENRVVAGMHYPSDIEAGRIAGSVISQALMQRDDFKSEFAAAKAELRSALGLSS
jgi:acid phosphatase (class A)